MQGRDEGPIDIGAMDNPSVRLLTALAWTKARRSRDISFATDIFSDPAWDMLLDLYVSRCRDRSVSVTDLCIASTAPATTALRWISILESQELIFRLADKKDRRRWMLKLTDAGVEKMETTLDKAMKAAEELGLSRRDIIE